MKTKFFVLALSLITFGCQSATPNSTKPASDSAKAIPAAIANNTNAVGNSDNANFNANSANTNSKNVARNFPGKGVVTKINLELVSVELNHEEIKGLMPAMIMEFFVKDKKQLEALAVGDKVDFVIEDKNANEIIIDIKKSN